jgi:hypothetical protein
MKIIIIFVAIILFSACGNSKQVENSTSLPKNDVTSVLNARRNNGCGDALGRPIPLYEANVFGSFNSATSAMERFEIDGKSQETPYKKGLFCINSVFAESSGSAPAEMKLGKKYLSISPDSIYEPGKKLQGSAGSSIVIPTEDIFFQNTRQIINHSMVTWRNCDRYSYPAVDTETRRCAVSEIPYTFDQTVMKTLASGGIYDESKMYNWQFLSRVPQIVYVTFDSKNRSSRSTVTFGILQLSPEDSQQKWVFVSLPFN